MEKNKTILITGGTGFLGSHTYIALSEAGYRPLILDNLSNSNERVLERLQHITQRKPQFIYGDIRDRNLLQNVLLNNKVEAVIHFAGFKAVRESIEQPLKYYDNNVHGTLELLEAMKQVNVKTLIFSSSATVYGPTTANPIQETLSCAAINPYGRTKLMIEQILMDCHHIDSEWRIACLRYFNPVGAHPSGLLGESPKDTPNNLMPYISQVALGHHPYLHVYGNDYDTPDGTGIRDYIHVMDLAEGHVATLDHLFNTFGFHILNLGTGQGVSVLQMIKTFEQVNHLKIPYKISPRRPGDVAACWADPTLAKRKINWRSFRTINDICIDTWRWQVKNPHGFTTL